MKYLCRVYIRMTNRVRKHSFVQLFEIARITDIPATWMREYMYSYRGSFSEAIFGISQCGCSCLKIFVTISRDQVTNCNSNENPNLIFMITVHKKFLSSWNTCIDYRINRYSMQSIYDPSYKVIKYIYLFYSVNFINCHISTTYPIYELE